MVDYQTAVAAVQDPQADPILLAKIAYENPEFGANVAVHPRAYPGLKRWLAEFGDKRARMTLAQMGVIATADPVEDRFDESETPSGQRNPEPARAVKLAVEHDFVVVHDFAYAGLGVEEQQHSLLEVVAHTPAGSPERECTVEICSLSKMYAMAGWRAGFIAGSERILDVAKNFHYQMGSMITSFVQDAGVAALNSDQTCVGRQAAHYAGRRAIVADGLRELGYDLFDSQGGLYVWMHAPAGRSGEEVADDLLDKAGVAVLPGTCFGNVGAQYVRLSLLQPDERLAEAVKRIGTCCC